MIRDIGILSNFNNFLEKVKQLIIEKRFEEALEIIEGLFNKMPHSKEILTMYVNTLFEYGVDLNDDYVQQYEKALECFKKILKLDSENYKIYYNQGISYFNLEKMDKAIDSYNKALEIKPNDKYSLYNLGYTFEKMGALKNALKYYKRALNIDPEFIYAIHAKHDIKKQLDFIKYSQPKKKINFNKLKSLLKVSKSIKIQMLQDVLDIEYNDLEIIIMWCEKYGFEIDGDLLIINKETLPELFKLFDNEEIGL